MDFINFSFIGLLFLLLLIIPNLIWAKRYRHIRYDSKDDCKILLIFERTGQLLLTATTLFFTRAEILPISAWSFWLLFAFTFMIFYELWWVRYFRSEKQLSDFYSSLLAIPLAGVTLPIIAFFLLGIYAKSIPLIVSVVIFAIGHIGIHLRQKKNRKII